jgi:hypothetical protein
MRDAEASAADHPATATLIRRLRRQPGAPKTASFASPDFRDGYKKGYKTALPRPICKQKAPFPGLFQ